jgi:hypothetical protein
MSYSETQEDRQWRCMAIAMCLYRYLERVGELMCAQSVSVTLTGLADYIQAGLASERCEERPAYVHSAWELSRRDFAVERVPEALRKLSTELGANGFDKMLGDGEYATVVLMVVTDVLAKEPSAEGRQSQDADEVAGDLRKAK